MDAAVRREPSHGDRNEMFIKEEGRLNIPKKKGLPRQSAAFECALEVDDMVWSVLGRNLPVLFVPALIMSDIITRPRRRCLELSSSSMSSDIVV